MVRGAGHFCTRMDFISKVLLLASLLPCVASYKIYQARIPNGDRVPHPCKPGKIWEGVGHYIAQGTGFRNAFGEDFANAGHQWTEELCRKDSDGDGLTNGQELGDPGCEWTENSAPKTTESITHPGMCDPWDGTDCLQRPTTHPQYTTQREWVDAMCQSDEFVCDGLDDPDLKSVRLRRAPTTLPAQVTTYMCQVFDLTKQGMEMGDYHMIAAEPIIDNTFVLHHMALAGCFDDAETGEPFECGMSAGPSCTEALHIWTVGMAGECYHRNSGVRIGLRGFKKVSLQLHYNNIEKHGDLTDTSGLVLHYTPNLRPYDAGVFTTGSFYFYLPPKQPTITIDSKCPAGCTKSILKGPIYVTAAWNHMHYAGRAMTVEVKRNKEHVSYLTNDKLYSYDSPVVHNYPGEPIKVMPGDDILTTCQFTTLDRNKTTFFGEATEDEMCFGVISYYPKENLMAPLCVDTNDYSPCDPENSLGCNLLQFMTDLTNSTVYKEVLDKCRNFSPCVPECKETVLHYMKYEPCLKADNIRDYLLSAGLAGSLGGHEFLSRLASCQVEVHLALHPQGTGNSGNSGNTAPELLRLQPTFLMGLMLLFATVF